MANFTDVDEVRAEALDRVGEPITSSSDFWNQSLVYLNQKYFEAWFDRPWLFTISEPPGAFASVAPITGLTVSVTIDVATATLSASQTPDLVKRKIKIGNNIYRITTHGGSSANITLDLAYIEATDAAIACSIFQDEYDLEASDFGRLVKVLDNRTGLFLKKAGMDHPRIRRQLANPSEGVPRFYAHMTESRILMEYYTQDARRYEYYYQTQPSDLAPAGALDFPRAWRHVIRDGAAGLLAQDKNDKRAQALLEAFELGLHKMSRQESWDRGLGVVGPPLIK